MDISILFKEEELMQVLTGIGIERFRQTAISLEWAVRSDLVKKGILDALDAECQFPPERHIRLFFILFYLRFHPTYELASFLFGMPVDEVSNWVEEFIPPLSRILCHNLRPAFHQIETLDELIQLVPEVRKLLNVAHMVQIHGKPTPCNDNSEAFFNRGKKHEH